MLRSTMIAGVILSGMFLLGCDTKEDTKPVENAPVTGKADGAPAANLPNSTDLKGATQNALDQGKVMGSEVQKVAEEKLAQVSKAIGEGNFPSADQILKSIESMKAQLPQNLQDKITEYRKIIDDGLAKAKNLIPGGLPGAGK